jgi:hypothetical protein
MSRRRRLVQPRKNSPFDGGWSQRGPIGPFFNFWATPHLAQRLAPVRSAGPVIPIRCRAPSEQVDIGLSADAGVIRRGDRDNHPSVPVGAMLVTERRTEAS